VIPKIYAKTVLDGGGGEYGMGAIGPGSIGRTRPQHTPGYMQEIIKAEIVIGSYQDGRVRILKDRLGGSATPFSGKATLDNIVEKSSQIICRCVFGDNDLSMFKEGLSQEIQESIKQTIKKFHERG